ncbi:uncharacterized protein K452DRAFT_244437 [Aplosporella prunicola CBS 121167]|uniref:Mitochondrial genome maintenance protein MGM101 n=1 Tax=Aplosporella prunicola CBS 121167 TaxID=1176127 RepID=A0A6A6BP02_9PEZI|nr:uncharacterized protein K452DRAFT_244437 [Aplosporella prunicola CBS 121167]KAF2144954.1 hypothetical protein K452DRAFT_244437 [Aplosporella prunicola CBS 121167]
MNSLTIRHASSGLRRCVRSSHTPTAAASTLAASKLAASRASTSRTYAYATSTTRAAPASSSSTTTPVRRAAPASASSASAPSSATAAAERQPPPPTARNTAASTGASSTREQRSLEEGLSDNPLEIDAGGEPSTQPDWSRSFHGMSSQAFSAEAAAALLEPIQPDDIEVKPDGIIYLPEIKYRRILNRAFGPGGWGLAPRSETIVTGKAVTREYGLVAGGRLVSIARGEQQYFDAEGIPTATEGCKSNALMRCCKDLGVASELWDPRFIRKFMKEYSKKVWVEHVVNKKRKQITVRKDDEVAYPWKEVRS